MRRQIVGAFFAAVAAGGAALLTGGLTGPAAADAATAGTHAAAYPVICTSSQAGYVTGGRWFRFVATTVKVPGAAQYNNYAEVVLGGSSTHIPPVTLAVAPGGGPDSVAWSVGVPPYGMGGGALTKVDPKAGDTVLIDLYYSQADGGVVATATDITANRTQDITIGTGAHAVFTAAEVADVLKNPSSPPAGNIRLWDFTNSAVTTYTGVHGSMTGPWATSEIIDTTNGGSSGQVVMSPSFLWNNGQNFGAWLRSYLR